MSDPLRLLDQVVRRLGAAVGGFSGGEVGQDLFFPGVDCASESEHFGYVGARAVVVEVDQSSVRVGEVVGRVDTA